ncbi:hypothetical protein BD413DRAFT_494225 [Trametes elegans]|nr:hypothetical protein BD413DRAFT_494225 [Trametes elegans]
METAPIEKPATPTRSEPRPTHKAAEPFDLDDADGILRSSDGVDFYVHRVILSLGPSVLNAANKYDAPAVLAVMKGALARPRLLREDPLRVFAIACCCGLEEEAEIAAERAVIDRRVVGQRSFAGLDEISAGAYHHLPKLNRTRTECSSMGEGSEVVNTVDFTDIGFVPGPLQDVHDDRPGPEVPFACPNADLILRSRDWVDFRVSRSVVALASHILLQNTHKEAQAHDEPLPVYVLSENSHVLDTLLRIVHPTDHSSTLGPNTNLAVWVESGGAMAKTANHSVGKARNPSDNLERRLAFLDVYTKEVDSAVTKVVLEFDEA